MSIVHDLHTPLSLLRSAPLERGVRVHWHTHIYNGTLMPVPHQHVPLYPLSTELLCGDYLYGDCLGSAPLLPTTCSTRSALSTILQAFKPKHEMSKHHMVLVLSLGA